ncbi:Tango14 [Drosophila busckii]|uniref:ditrans,polycis-polyprenyl diphosphate synthase [(2E,6E)-farnesyldiphosphate specific] n=1 Tax=Drosophila busckii TaxID=30019 RepID=A0A0M4EPC8_DROBS|nr:Tango14 [Drosophila busckii]
MMQLICPVIGWLIWLFFYLHRQLQLLWRRLHALVCRSCDYWQCDQRELFKRATHELEKLPQHLVLVIAPDERYVDAALLKNILSYALNIGIKYLSIYDTRTARTGHVELSKLCEPTKSRAMLWPPSKQKEQNGNCNGTRNGYAGNGLHPTQLQVYQIGHDDCHALIADVCRELYEQSAEAKQKLLQKRETLTDAISAGLNKRLEFAVPEPEMGIVFAKQT